MLLNVPNIELLSVIAFAGITLFQSIYLGAQYVFIRRKEYLYYLAYLASNGVYCFSRFDWLIDSLSFLEFFKNSLDRVLPMLSFFLYYRFARFFLDLPVLHPKINRLSIYVEHLLLIYISIDLLLLAVGFSHAQREPLFVAVSVVLGIATLLLAGWLAQRRETRGYFIFVVALLMTSTSVAGMIMILTQYNGFHPTLPMVFATMTEFLILNTALAFKARQIERKSLLLKQENIQQLEQKLQLQNQIALHREQAAREIHNELGSGISDIHIFSAMAEKELQNTQGKAQMLNQQVRKRATLLLDKVQDIIWALSPHTNTLNELEERLRLLCREKLSPENLNYSLRLDELTLRLNASPDSLRKVISLSRECLSLLLQNRGEAFALSNTAEEMKLSLSFSEGHPALPESLKHLVQQLKAQWHTSNSAIEILIPLTTIRD